MADKAYKVGEAIEVVYQAGNAKTGATVNMEVYDEAHIIVEGGPIVLTELGASGRYYGPFVPDAEGEWSVQIQESDGTGKVTKAFSVGSHNVKDIGASVDTIENDVTTLGTNLGVTEGKVDTVSSKADTTHTKVDAVDAKIDTLDSSIVTLDGKVGGLDSPPMVG